MQNKGNSQEEADDYRLLRSKNVMRIRKHQRQDIFNKRRHTHLDLSHIGHEVVAKIYDEYNNQHDDVGNQQYKEEGLTECHEQEEPKEVTDEGLEDLLECMESDDESTVLSGVASICKLLLRKHPPTLQIIKMGIHMKLIALTHHSLPEIRKQAWWSLVNVSYGYDGECTSLIQAGILESFFRCLEEEDIQLVEQGVWGLANIASDGADLRDRVLKQGGLSKLITVLFKFEDQPMAEEVGETISCLCLGKPLPAFEQVEEGLLMLCSLIANDCIKNKEYLSSAVHAIKWHCTADRRKKEEIRAMLKTQFLPKIVELTAHSQFSVSKGSMQIIGNMLTGDSELFDEILQVGVLDCFEKCLTDPSKINMRATTCWALANLAQGDQPHVSLLLARKKILSLLQSFLLHEAEEVQMEVIQIFTRMGQNCGTFQLEEFYVSSEVIQAMVELLKDEKTIFVQPTLKCLFNMLCRAEEKDKLEMLVEELQRSNGLILLQRFQFSDKPKISYESRKIVSRFFNAQELSELIV